MKNSFLVLGGLLVVINTTIGIVISTYEPFNMVMVDVSILFSTALIYKAYSSEMADGFKIGYTVLFAITGLARIVCSVLSPELVNGNIALLVFVTLLAIEGFCVHLGSALKDK